MVVKLAPSKSQGEVVGPAVGYAADACVNGAVYAAVLKVARGAVERMAFVEVEVEAAPGQRTGV